MVPPLSKEGTPACQAVDVAGAHTVTSLDVLLIRLFSTLLCRLHVVRSKRFSARSTHPQCARTRSAHYEPCARNFTRAISNSFQVHRRQWISFCQELLLVLARKDVSSTDAGVAPPPAMAQVEKVVTPEQVASLALVSRL